MTVAPRTRITTCGMGSALIQVSIPGEGQLTRRIRFAEEDRGDGITCLGTQEPTLNNGRHLIDPRHGHGITADVHIDKTWVYSHKCLDEFVLTVWQLVLVTVVPFTILIVTLVQTADEDHHISLLGFFKSLRLQFCRRACLVKRTSNGNTIETLNRVTDIAAGVIEPHPLPLSKGRGEFRVDTIQWQDLVLHF